MKFRNHVQDRPDLWDENKFKIRQATDSYFAGQSLHDTSRGSYHLISFIIALTCGFASGIVGHCILSFFQYSGLLNYLKEFFFR